jgi:hypothetical protein
VTYKDNVTEIAAVETTPTTTRNLPAQVGQGIKVQSAQADFGLWLP